MCVLVFHVVCCWMFGFFQMQFSSFFKIWFTALISIIMFNTVLSWQDFDHLYLCTKFCLNCALLFPKNDQLCLLKILWKQFILLFFFYLNLSCVHDFAEDFSAEKSILFIPLQAILKKIFAMFETIIFLLPTRKAVYYSFPFLFDSLWCLISYIF